MSDTNFDADIAYELLDREKEVYRRLDNYPTRR